MKVPCCRLSDEERMLEALKVLSSDLLEFQMPFLCSDRRGKRVDERFLFYHPYAIGSITPSHPTKLSTQARCHYEGKILKSF